VREEPQQVPSSEPEIEEVWERLTDDPETRDVEAAKWVDGDWVVIVAVQEFFRRDPVGLELRQRIASALRSVDGVTGVGEHDNESWWVEGNASGEALTRAAADVVDDMADRLQGWPES
jgi:hypothetical protein